MKCAQALPPGLEQRKFFKAAKSYKVLAEAKELVVWRTSISAVVSESDVSDRARRKVYP